MKTERFKEWISYRNHLYIHIKVHIEIYVANHKKNLNSYVTKVYLWFEPFGFLEEGESNSAPAAPGGHCLAIKGLMYFRV